jgi:hypothetical protein
MPIAAWLSRRPRVGLAFTERFLLGRSTKDGALVRRALPDGLVVPSPSAPNIQSLADVAKLATEILEELDARRQPVSIVLPDRAVATAFSPASAGDVQKVESRLGASSSGDRRDFWRGRKGEILGAAAKGVVVRQYEQVVEASECRPGWVDCASLVRIPLWTEGSLTEPGLSLRVQLYPGHYVLAAFRAGELVDLRIRLRTSGDASSVSEEIRRVPAFHGVTSLVSLTLSGAGAEEAAAMVEGAARATSVVEDSEERQLEGALDELLRRGRA